MATVTLAVTALLMAALTALLPLLAEARAVCLQPAGTAGGCGDEPR